MKIDEIMHDGERYRWLPGGTMLKDADVRKLTKLCSSPSFLRLLEMLREKRIVSVSPAKLMTKVKQLCDALGVPLSDVKLSLLNKNHTVAWDGNQLLAGGMDGTELLHEVCHWQVALAEIRKMPDFGLGARVRPDKAVDDLAQTRSWHDREVDEAQAGIMEALWLADWGFPTSIIGLEFAAEVKHWDEAFASLRDSGLCTGDFQPVVAVRTNE